MKNRIFLGLLFYVSIVLLGHFSYGAMDNRMKLHLTHSLAFEGSVNAPKFGPIKYAPLQSVLMIPTYVLGHLAGKVMGRSEERCYKIGYRVTSAVFNPVVISLMCVLYFTFIGEFGFDVATRLVSSYLLLFGTLLLPYARLMYSEPVSAFLILVSLYFLYRSFHGDTGVNLRKSFVSTGVLCLNNAVFFLFYLLLVLSVLFYFWFAKRDAGVVRRVIFESLVVLFIVMGIFLFYNYARYGSFLQFGYKRESFTSPIVIGLYGLLFSIGRGLILYSPLTLPCVVFFVVSYQNFEFDRSCLLGVAVLSFAVFLGVYGKWYSWEGGWCWGPRYLLSFVPAVHLVFPFLLTAVKKSNRLIQAFFIAVCLVSIGINGYEYVHVWGRYETDVLMHQLIPYEYTLFIPKFSYLFNNWEWEVGIERILQFVVVLSSSFCFLWFWFRKRLA